MSRARPRCGRSNPSRRSASTADAFLEAVTGHTVSHAAARTVAGRSTRLGPRPRGLSLPSYTGAHARPLPPPPRRLAARTRTTDPRDPAKRHSAALTDGPDRAGARAMLKAIGFTDEDLAKPLVGVATTWIETMPCNYNQRRLAEHVKAGIRAAGGTPMEFNTISVSDGVSMGTEGMKARWSAARSIADSIELVVRGHLLDGVVCLVGCDKTIPGAAMALGRLDVPGARPLQRDDLPRRLQGQAERDRRHASTRRSAPTGRARSRSTSCTRSRTSRVPGPAPAVASTPPTR